MTTEHLAATIAPFLGTAPDQVPGAVAVVDTPGKPVALVAAAGYRRDTIVRISSTTKPIVAAAALTFVDDGSISLDEPLERSVLPELAGRRVLVAFDAPLTETVPAERPITLRDLLAFTLGFGIPMRPPGATPIQRALEPLALGQGRPAPQHVVEPHTWLARFATLPLMHQPGARWMYSTGLDLAGIAIARLGKAPLADVLRARLFAPLGMRDTDFHVPPGKLPRFVPGYAAGAAAPEDAADATSQWAAPPAFPSGAAGLVSTVDDLLAFARMLRDRGGAVLQPATVAEMTRGQLTDAQRAASNDFVSYFVDHTWGLGVGIDARTGAYGWDGGLGTTLQLDPASGRIAILLTQRAWASPIPPPIAQAFLAAAPSC